MKKNLIFWSLYLILSLSNVIALENKIILKVDNEIITSLDINREIKYLSTLNPSIKSLSNDRLRLIGKNSLIKEKIKKKEILKYMKEINVNQNFLKELIRDRYNKLNFKTENEKGFHKNLNTTGAVNTSIQNAILHLNNDYSLNLKILEIS